MKGFKFHEMSFWYLILFLLWCGVSIISLHESDAIHMLSYPYVSWRNPICLYLSIFYWEWLFCNIHVNVWRLLYACGLCEWIWRSDDKFGCSLLIVFSLVCLFIYSVLPLIRLEFTVVYAAWSAPATCLCLLSSLIVGFVLLPLHLSFKHGFWGLGGGGTWL